MQRLTAIAVKQAKPKAKPYKLSDGRGLYLHVMPKGKYWRYKYRYAGKEKLLALGIYPAVSLESARKKHIKARESLALGKDPSILKKELKNSIHEAHLNSFEATAKEWLDKRGAKSEGGDKRLHRLLQKDLFPFIGHRPVSEITPTELLKCLRKIENRGAIDTAHRAKQIAGMVFRYAVATGRADSDPSRDLKDALAKPTKTHFKAITEPKDLVPLLIAINSYQATPVVMAALKLTPLLLCRPGELRHLEWIEVDLEKSQIEIPAEKMQKRKKEERQPHIIPLATQAKEILTELSAITGRGKYVFPSARSGKRPLSENGVRTALRTLGYTNDQVSPHGFRATARTLLDEILGYRVDWIEHQLAHKVKDPNGTAYNRTKYLQQRREMMQTWANYLDGLAAGNNNIVFLRSFNDG